MSKRITGKQVREMIAEVEVTIVDFAHEADLNEQTLYKAEPDQLLSRKSSRKCLGAYEALRQRKIEEKAAS